MTAGAGFHHHRAGGDVRQLGRQLAAREFLAKHHSARRILRMKLEALCLPGSIPIRVTTFMMASQKSKIPTRRSPLGRDRADHLINAGQVTLPAFF